MPLLALIVFSFNDSKRTILWKGFTLDWYAKLFADTDLLTAFANSLAIAAISTLISTLLGTLTALLLWRFRFPLKAALEGALALPIVVPEICLGVAFLVFFTTVLPWPPELPWPLNLGAIANRACELLLQFRCTRGARPPRELRPQPGGRRARSGRGRVGVSYAISSCLICDPV